MAACILSKGPGQDDACRAQIFAEDPQFAAEVAAVKQKAEDCMLSLPSLLWGAPTPVQAQPTKGISGLGTYRVRY